MVRAIKHPKLTPEQAAVSLLGTALPAKREVRHYSYSSRTKYEECPKGWELAYQMGAPKKGAVWFVGGKAVHRATEEWELGQLAGTPVDLPAVWDRVFREELASSQEQDPAMGSWRKAGVKADNPNGEDVAAWYSTIGPAQVEAYMAWRKRTPHLRVWTAPDGKPGIELDVSCSLPGFDLEVKAFIDRIFHDKLSNQLLVVDIKTGSRKPDRPLQFGVYAACTQERYGAVIAAGAAFMTRRGILTDLEPMAKYTPAYVGKHFGQMHRAVQAGYFPPKDGHHCGLCDVSAACFAVDGPLAAQYDPDTRQGVPY